MSWQRIDENTYIDDTLVTCAEYQLFTDEMREQGKHYQPDHWTEYQFPTGQAREPVLGVRYSDAIAFCEWLTQRESEEWKYRIPTEEEALSHTINFNYQTTVGYWLMVAYSQQMFFWLTDLPQDARKIALMHAPSRERIRDLRLFPIVEKAMARAQRRALDLDEVLALDRILALNLSKERTQAVIQNRIRILDRSAANTHDRSFRFIIKLTLDLNHTQALDLYVDIFTLKERIAGRSPAFEGIRLVKERIR